MASSPMSCPRCGYSTCIRSNLKKHLKRKTLCAPNVADISREATLEQFPGLMTDRRVSLGDKKIMCDNCGSMFTTETACYRHKRNYCTGVITDQMKKLLQSQNDMKILNEALLKKLDALSANEERPPTKTENIHHNTNSHNTQNIQVNVIQNPFGKEDLSHISLPFMHRCVLRTNKGLLDLLEKVHFDPQKPGNANVRIMNRKMPLAEVRDENGDWKFVRRDAVLNDMLDKGQELMQEHFEGHEDELRTSTSDTMFEYIQEWFSKVEDKDKTLMEDLLTDIYIIILNNSRKMGVVVSVPENSHGPLP